MTTPFIPETDICRKKSIDLLIASIAFEELGLAQIIKAEADKIQFVLKMHDDHRMHDENDDDEPTIEDLLEINKSVERMLRKVIMKEMLLSFKLEDAIELMMNEDNDDDDEDNDDEDNDQ